MTFGIGLLIGLLFGILIGAFVTAIYVSKRVVDGHDLRLVGSQAKWVKR